MAAPVPLPSPIGNIWAGIERFRDLMTFLVFLQDGYAALLEGAAIRDDTTGLNFGRLGFNLKP